MARCRDDPDRALRRPHASCCSTGAPRSAASRRAEAALARPARARPRAPTRRPTCASCARRSPTPRPPSQREDPIALGYRLRHRRRRAARAAPTRSRRRLRRARRRRGRPRVAADPRLPPGDPLHAPGGRRDDRARRARGRRAVARPTRSPRSARTCSTPTSRACSTYLDEAATESERGYEPAVAESTAIAAGYWTLLAPEYEEQRGAAARARGRPRLRARCPSIAATPQRSRRGRRRASALLDHFTAAPFTARGAGAPRAAADPLPRADPARVRPRRLRDRGDDARSRSPRRSPSPTPPTSALSDLSPVLDERDPEALAELEDDDRRARRATSTTPTRAATVVPLEDDRGARRTRAQDARRGDLPRGVARVHRRGRLRPGPDQPRPDGGRRQRRRAADRRAGAPDRLRLLRVRPRDQAARLRPGPGARGRGTDVVRRQRRGRARSADRRRRRRRARSARPGSSSTRRSRTPGRRPARARARRP